MWEVLGCSTSTGLSTTVMLCLRTRTKACLQASWILQAPTLKTFGDTMLTRKEVWVEEHQLQLELLSSQASGQTAGAEKAEE